MAGNDNRRRKKIEAQRAKRKEQQKALARVESSGVVAKIIAAKNWPIIHSRVSPNFGQQGMASAMLTRRGPHDQMATVIFLVDAYFLGVKDVAIFVGPEGEWLQRVNLQQERGMRLEDVAPESLRKFVEGAVAFAKSFGISPHRDYAHALPIFGNIDASQCLVEFTYGRDGKPLFIPGPYDSPERIQQIMSLLGKNVDGDNFEYAIPIDRDELIAEATDDTIELLDAD